MKSSLTIFRVLFACLFLAVAGNAVASYVNDKPNATIESISSASLLGFAAPALKAPAKQNRKRKTVKTVAFEQVTIIKSGGGYGTVGQQNLLPRSPEYSGAAGGQGRTLQSNMPTPINNVLPESTMAGLLSFTWTADNTYNGTDYVPFFPSSLSDSNRVPAGVTFASGNFTDLDEFLDYYTDNALVLGDILISTDDQANYGKAIRSVSRAANGAQTPNALSWNSISKNPSNYDQTVRIIQNSGWTIGLSKVRYEGLMKASTYMTFDCNISQIGDVKQFRPHNG